MIADGIYKRSESRGITHAFLAAKKHKNADKGLLPDVLYRISGVQPGTQLQVNQLTEVMNKVLLSAAIALAQTIEVSVIELLELQAMVLKIKCFVSPASKQPMAKLYIARMQKQKFRRNPAISGNK
jgi:hypothetical protein